MGAFDLLVSAAQPSESKWLTSPIPPNLQTKGEVALFRRRPTADANGTPIGACVHIGRVPFTRPASRVRRNRGLRLVYNLRVEPQAQIEHSPSLVKHFIGIKTT